MTASRAASCVKESRCSPNVAPLSSEIARARSSTEPRDASEEKHLRAGLEPLQKPPPLAQANDRRAGLDSRDGRIASSALFMLRQ